MAFDDAGGTGALTLDPDDVETSPAAKALDPSEVEDAPGPRPSSFAQSASPDQPRTTTTMAVGGSRYEANIPNPSQNLPIAQPAGATGPLPGIPQPRVDMQGQPLIQTIFGTDPVRNARMSAEVQDPGYLKEHPPQVYNYGQNAIPRVEQGVKEAASPGQRIKGATDILGGVNDALGSSLLPLGSAPAAVAKGIAGSVAGSVAAPYAVKKLGGSPEAQALAGEVGAALPLAGGMGADLLRRPRPEVIPPVRPGNVDVPEAGNLLPAGEPQTINAAPTDSAPNPQPATTNRLMLGSGENSSPDVRYKNGRAFVQDPKTGWWQPQSDVAASSSAPGPTDITVHRAGKVSGIDEATGLPIVDRSQPSEIRFSARGENLPPQAGTAAPMSPEAEAISAEAAESSQSERGQEESQPLPQTQTTPQNDDLSTKLASIGLHGDEAKSILDMYGIDPRGTNASASAEDAAGRPWEEQVQDAYTTLAKQRGIPVGDDDETFRDQDTARDARNAVEKVISHVYSEADSDRETRPATEQSITLSPGEAEDAPVSSDADRARQNYGDFLDRVGTRTAMESHGQDILDRMDETGESPRDVSDKFWNETYFELPAAAQQRFTRMLKNVSGFEPGDTIAVRPDKSGIVAQDWADVAKGLLPEKVEHLEGPERGLTALMKEANDRVSGSTNRNSNQAKIVPSRPETASPIQFETAQGSTYTVNGESTIRNKSLHAGHDPQDVGLKKPSEKTVYVDPKLATEVGAWNTLSAEGKRIRIVGNQIQLLSNNPRTGQLGIDRTINNPSFTTAPEVGKSPLELWTSDERGMYAGNHPGNAIVRVDGGSTEPTIGARPVVMPVRNPYAATPGTPARYGQVMPVQPAPKAVLSPVRPTVRPVQPRPAAGPSSSGRQAGAAVQNVSTQDLAFDPRRFQYKLNTSAEGVTDLLKGKRWNDDLAGEGRAQQLGAAGNLIKAKTNAGIAERAGLFGKETPKSQTMYSGAAIFDPEAWKTLFPDVAERFSDWVNDKQDEGDRQAAIMRETRGELDRKVSIAAKQLERVQRDFRLRPRQDALNFFNAAEGVTPMSSIPARDQALAATFKGYFDKMRAELQSLNPNVLRDFIENYFPHIWERPSHAASVFQQVLSGKRPFAGSGAFLKQRTIPTIQDGIALGLKPVSYNPVDLFLAKYHEMSRFLMAHKTLGMMKDAGTAKLVRPGTAPPDGWTQLDDRIGTVMSTDADGHLFIRGHYYAPAPAAKVFNAYVSKGLAGRSAIFDALQAANNRLNALQLGISAFHATTTAVNAAASDIALGTQQLTQGKPLQGMKNIAEGVTYVPSMISTFRNGSKLMKEYLSPGSYAKFAHEANAISMAGGRIRQNTLEIKPLTQALDDLKAGAIGSAMKKTIPALIDASSRPIMEQWVPRMKLGAFYDMAHNILDTADREGWSQDRVRTRMQSAWNSIDNRFGQMVYDNLFWNKALRDVLMASTRSVGWNAGTIRELGGAAVDTAQQAGKVASGKAPELTDRMAFAIGMTVSAGLMGSAIYYLLNGERPQTWKDAYFPGKKGEARMSVPGYMKDVVAYAHDPKQTILNKMSPVLSMLSAALENRDFYGTEIRHPDDPVVQQLWQLAKFAGAEAVPFSVRGVQKLVQQKGSLETSFPGQVKQAFKNPKELVAGQFGFQPAPAYIQNSPALNKAHEYDMANMPPGTRTQEQAEKQRLRNAIAIQYRSGHPDHAAIEQLVREGKLTQREVNAAIVTAKTDPLVRAARPLHLDQLLNVYADANQRERRELRPILTRKSGDIQKEADPQRRAALRAAWRNALQRPSGSQNSGFRRDVALP